MAPEGAPPADGNVHRRALSCATTLARDGIQTLARRGAARRWLTKAGLSRYAPRFAAANVDDGGFLALQYAARARAAQQD